MHGNKVGKAFVMVFQISISMIVPMIMCGAGGYYLDKILDTSFLFILLLLLGILAAFRNVYLLTKSFYQKDMEEEHARLAYFEDLKREGREALKQSKEQEPSSLQKIDK